MRIYDPRLGRFLSRDPLTSSYPYYTPYSFAGNKPIWCIDLDGCEDLPATKGLWLTGNFWDDLMAFNKRTNPTLEAATTNGVIKSVRKTWGFISSDAWKAQTWKNAAKFVEQGAMSMSSVPVVNTPMVDAKVNDFMTNVVAGDSYSRTEYFSEFGMDLFTAYAGSKGIGAAKELVVAKYMAGTFRIGVKTLANVTAHLEQFGLKAENTIMLNRMKQIANKKMVATEIDLNFAKHELREAELMKSGKTYEQAHENVLKEQNMYHRGYENKLYTEDAIKAGNAQMEKEAIKR